MTMIDVDLLDLHLAVVAGDASADGSAFELACRRSLGPPSQSVPGCS